MVHRRLPAARPTALLLLCLVAAAAAARPANAGEFPDGWYYYGGVGAKLARLRDLEGKPAPPLSLHRWIGEAQSLEGLKGKIVVIDFWATWCGPCRAALPKNVGLASKYADDGVVFLGIHDADKGTERMADVARQTGINYPLAIDRGGATERAYRVQFWPTYAVLDRAGVVRAIGVRPNHIEPIIQRLRDEGLDQAVIDARPEEVPPAWLEGNRMHREAYDAMVDKPAPAISSSTWLNSEPLTLKDLEGKVVLLDFWATWCAPCIRSVPTMNRLQKQYADQGLVVIGVCERYGAEKMATIVESQGIEYAVCADDDRMFPAYKVDGRPDYHLIDREGRLRVADCKNGNVEEAIRMLLAEDAEQAER